MSLSMSKVEHTIVTLASVSLTCSTWCNMLNFKRQYKLLLSYIHPGTA